MLIRCGFRQALRAPVRMLVCLILMTLICAFLTVGLDLRASTQENLEAIYGSFEVIAVPDFQAYVNNHGQRVSSGQHDGYWPCAAENYDLEPIRNAYGVTGIDVRGRYGAVVENEGFQRGFSMAGTALRICDVIRFVYTGEEEVALSAGAKGETAALPLEILWSAAGYGKENYSSALPLQNNSSFSWVLEPGKEYIATVTMGQGEFGTRHEQIKFRSLVLTTGNYYRKVAATYDEGAQWEYFPNEPYEPLALYSEDFWETAQGEMFAMEARSCDYNTRSINAVTTGDLGSALPFYQGFVSVVEGRTFSREEYDTGASLCLVSRYLAGLNGWNVGDRVELSLYETEYLFSKQNRDQIPRYVAPVEMFFDSGSYEIIGMYDGRVTTGIGDSLSTAYSEEQGVLWIDLYLPKNAVRNAPEPKLSQYNTTIRLEPLAGQQFLAEMADSGLMKPQQDGYELGLTLYDQGLSSASDGLVQMEEISRLTVILSVVVAFLAVVVLAAFHVWRSQREIAALRSLGLRRWQTVVTVLAAILTVCAVGCVLGTVLGHEISGWAAGKILETAAMDSGDLTFTASIADMHLTSRRELFTFREVQQRGVAMAFSGGIWCFMLLLGVVLVWNESRKPPLLQMGRKE